MQIGELMDGTGSLKVTFPLAKFEGYEAITDLIVSEVSLTITIRAMGGVVDLKSTTSWTYSVF